MTVYWMLKESDQATADNKGELTTAGADTNTAPMRVPTGASKISRVRVVVIPSATFAADASAHFIRMEGNGLKSGSETLAAGADGEGTAVNTTRTKLAEDWKVDFPVTPGNAIQFFGETDADLGTVVFAVSVKFE